MEWRLCINHVQRDACERINMKVQISTTPYTRKITVKEANNRKARKRWSMDEERKRDQTVATRTRHHPRRRHQLPARLQPM